jgi:hypothetical protein
VCVARLMIVKQGIFACWILFVLWASTLWADENDQQSYPEVGITTSGPSIGYWWGRTGVRVTGMYINKAHHELHLNLGYAFADSAKVQQSLNLLTSWVVGSDPGADYQYGATGIAYALNYRGFFVEIGLAHPWRDDIGNLENDPVIPCGYLGYIYRFQVE